MKKKAIKKTVEPVRRRESQRAMTERKLGKMLLKGQIPVVPPKILRCPAPNSPEFEETCKKYEKGELSYEDVLTKVGESMKKPEPKPEGESTKNETT